MTKDLKFVKNSRTMAENESHYLPESVKEYAIDLRKRTELQKLEQNIESRNIRALTDYNGVAPIVIDGINLILTKTAMFMQKHGIKRLQDVPGYVYDYNTNCFSLAMPMDKFLDNMLGDFEQYAPAFKAQCEKLAKAGNKVIWSREKKVDARGNLVLDENGKPIEKIVAIRGQAISVQFKAEFDITIDKEIERLASTQAGASMTKEELRNQATTNVMTRARNLQRARNNASSSAARLPRETAVIIFNNTLFQSIYNQTDASINRSFFYTTPFLQLKLMASIQAAMDTNLFARFNNGFLCQKKFLINAHIARQLILYLILHDNGGDKITYDVYDLAEAVLPSFINSTKGRYISPSDQLTIRWIIFKVCVVYSIMLCKGLLDGNRIVPVYDVDRIMADRDNNQIRLVHSNSKTQFSFSDDTKRQLHNRLTQKLGFDPLVPLLDNN